MASNAKRAGEEADRMIAELNQARRVAQAEQPTSEEQLVVVDDAIPPQEKIEAGNQTDVGVPAETPLQTESVELALLRKEVETANQRWSVLQGMINKKDSELDQMRALLAQVNQKPEKQDTPAQSKLVTEQDEETFGADHVELGRRIAAEVFEQKIGVVMERLAQLENSIGDVSAMSAKTSAELFDEALERQVPNWKTINVQPAFLTWLNEEEGFAGATRLSLLKDAYAKMDLQRTARFFKAFEALTVAEPVATATAATPVKNVAPFVSPGKSRSQSTPAAPQDQKKVWNRDAISKLYEAKRNGRISQEEFDLQERDLFRAQNENRIAA